MEVSAFGSPIKKALAGSFKENTDAVREAFHIPDNEDVVSREFKIGDKEALLIYIDGMADDAKIVRYIMSPLMMKPPKENEALSDYFHDTLPASSLSETMQLATLVERVLNGDTALLADGLEGAIIVDVKGYTHRPVSHTVNESVIIGPQEGFNESLRDNVVLMRRILRSPAMISERFKIGNRVPSNVCVVYLSGVARADMVQRVKDRLMGINIDYVMSAGMLEQLLEDRPFSLLPQTALTERPDRAASFLVEGQILIFLENAPFALALPIDLLHLFHAPDDTAMRWQYGTFLRVLRLIGVMVSLLLPALFVALSMHHLEGMSLAMVTSIGESQADVPLSLLSSTLMMLVAFSLINEAATRVPGALSTGLSILGGLVLGTAAVEADIVSPLVIIVVALAGIGSFAVPDYPLTIALRIMQIFLVIAAGMFGFFGLCLISFFFLAKLMTLTSLGAPYYSPISPTRPQNPDRVIRMPIWRQRLRGYLAAPTQMRKLRGRMRAWEDKENED